MPRLAVVLAASASATLSGVWADPSPPRGKCQFDNEPLYPGYFWDPTCKDGEVGCLADGRNTECRFCGGGGYNASCPSSTCHFPGGDPFVPYYWDPDCAMGDLGCWADGIHAQCRFCGEYPYTSIPCPERHAAAPQGAACAFAERPATPHFWDPSCRLGVLGCLADGSHEQCRFCGIDDYIDIPCPAVKACSFASEPTVPYYWDESCAMGKLGCNADGVNVECRFCARRPFESIACPEEVAPPRGSCAWPRSVEPATPYYWEPSCRAGMLGCWADGIHAECRFCMQDVFRNITCSAVPAGAGTGGAQASSADAAAADVPATTLTASWLSAAPPSGGSPASLVLGLVLLTLVCITQMVE